ncbi:MAG: altronate oxidoreductase [Saprospiraceae bacterium]|nr:MAG: altronate oxidoreductase [Saprospiraceae bacterium]
MQFGGGNFLRGFVDWIIDIYNEKSGTKLGVLVVKPTEQGDYQNWRDQDGLFHVLTKGIRNGQLVDEQYLVKCISRIVHPYLEWNTFLQSAENPALRYIISNTTESGIRTSPNDLKTDQPPKEFPAKLTLWLHHRYLHFRGAYVAGCVIIPTELLIDNGDLLKGCILQYAENWQLEAGFKEWINSANIFCNTLVDRIIPGVGKDALNDAFHQVGYQDDMITQGEPYHLWAIEAPESVREELPLDKIGLNIVYTEDLTPFRTIKVRILNGAHTAMVPVGYLFGIETVRETVEHEVMGEFVKQVLFDEIIPTLDLPMTELQQFGNDVLDRFKNPFIKHYLLSISLNSISKFKTRVLPSLLEYQKRKGVLPKGLVFSFVALIRFYKGEFNNQTIPLNDDPMVIEFLKQRWKECDGTEAAFYNLVEQILKWEKAWEADLSSIIGLKEMIAQYLIQIEKVGMQKTVKSILT